ncbi:unnamed protein product [Peronospora belbahrii]|uniref:WRKY transcription factor 19 n=1 Tax=Peronospora belbahrii TaxID=622444 RepID=A0AAU9L573_9STRA|nr:unnamed protein product [Peronospora belbahrii]CAH0521095.1 unnamed protein product [Peronospora belbahrii]
MGERSTPFGSSNSPVPPPPNSLLGGGIALAHLQTPFQPSISDDPPLFVRLNEDDMFNQMLNDQDFADFHHGHHTTTNNNNNNNSSSNNSNNKSLKKEHEGGARPHLSTNPLLLEPLELPRGHDDHHCLKDTIYNDSTTFQQSFRNAGAPTRSGILSSSATAASASAASHTMNGFAVDSSNTNIMSVYPLGSNAPVYFGTGEYSNFPPTSPHSWIQEEHTHNVSTSSNVNYQRVHTMKHMMTMAGVGMIPQQPSPGSVDMFHHSVMLSSHHPSSPELWISTSRNSSLDVSISGERNMMKHSLDGMKMPVERSPLSLTISPPASLTDKALKELIVSADFGSPTSSRQKRARTYHRQHDTEYSRAKTARMTSPVGQLSNNTPKATDKSTKGKKCVEIGCTRRAQSNSRCKAHGGGARCQYAGPGGCTRSSQGGGFCRAHGGGKRCEFPGCTRGQQRKGRCYVHGGIRKCQYGTCEKKDRGNGFCISHGGGKRCDYPNCSRAVRRGLHCQIHETPPATEKERGETIVL